MKSPFKFLDSFTKEDRAIFFGRERETEELYQKVFESKILLVYGVSGTGKSSLINCGLANKFQDSDWLPINVRRVNNINDSLKNAVTSLAIEKLDESKSLKKHLQSLYLDHFKPIYIIFDQFEELFIFGDDSEKIEFIKSIKKISESEIQCKFLFVIREEYLASITEFERQIPEFLQNRIRIEKMRRTNAVECIEGPCKVNGIEVEEGFADALLDKLNPNSSEVELTYLQVFLDRVFKETSMKCAPHPIESFDHSIIDSIGDVSDLLGAFLDEQISQLQNPDEAMSVLKSFVSNKGTKRPVCRDEVIAYAATLGTKIDEKKTDSLIQSFVNLRILRDKDENDRYELRHDALASKIFEKIDSNEKEIIEVRQFIENAFHNYKKRNVLLNNDDLNYIKQYEKQLFLPEDQNYFLTTSKESNKSKKKTLKRITVISAVVFVLTLVAIIRVAYLSYIDSVADRNAQTSLYRATIPSGRFIVAEDAFSLNRTSLIYKAILEAFYALVEDRDTLDISEYVIPENFAETNAKIQFADFTNDRSHVYAYMADSTAKIWKGNGNEELSIKLQSSSIYAMKVSPDIKHVALLGNDSLCTVFSIKGDSLFSINVQYNRFQPSNAFVFSPDNKFISCVSPENNIALYSMTGELTQTLAGHDSLVNCVDITGDGRFIASASADKSVKIWYFNKVKKQYDLYNHIYCHNDTVWSAKFSNNNKYLLTASADSICSIWNVNGISNYGGVDYYDRTPDMISGMYDAEFSAGETAIVLHRYYSDTTTNETGFYETGLSENSNTGKIYISTKNLFGFDYIDFSDKEKICAYVDFQDTVTKLISMRDDFIVKQIPGNKPAFSDDSKYLLTIDNNKIYIHLIDIYEMFDLVRNKKIFGEIGE